MSPSPPTLERAAGSLALLLMLILLTLSIGTPADAAPTPTAAPPADSIHGKD